MKIELKNMHSPDILDLKNYYPQETDNCGFLHPIIVGRIGQEKDGENFDVFVCTPKWLIENKSKESIIIGLHHILVFEYSYTRLESKLQSLISDI